MDPFTCILFLVLSIFTWIFLFKHEDKRIRKLIDQFPGPKSYPLVGTTWPLLFMTQEEIFRYRRSLAVKYGPVHRLWFGKYPVISLTDPKYAEIILNNSLHIDKGNFYDYLKIWLGNGLITAKGTDWHRNRKLLTPSFHFKILDAFLDTFVEKSKVLVQILKEKANGRPFSVFPYLTSCTLDIIYETAMGVQINVMTQPRNEYADAIHGVCEEIVQRVNKPWLTPDFIYYRTEHGKKFAKYIDFLHKTADKVIKDKKEALNHRKRENKIENHIEDEIGRKKRTAFLDLLLEVSDNGTVFTHEQIRNEVDTFLFAGHDTTSVATSWTLFLLGLYPDIQEKAYEEICHIIPNGHALSLNDLNDLKYLERIFKESLRLFPSVGTIVRVASKDIDLDGQYTIPAGCPVSIQIFDIHRNEKYYPESRKFDPDRFLPENSKNRHPYAFIPFSAGPRNCLGQKFAMYEAKTILSYIIKNFKIKSTQTLDSVNPVLFLMVRPGSDLLITLEPRTQSQHT